MNFQVGEKVVCVDDGPPRNNCGCKLGQCPLRQGAVYTVSGLYHHPTVPGISITGIKRPFCPLHKTDHYFLSNRFRRLSDMRAEAKLKKAVKLYLDSKNLATDGDCIGTEAGAELLGGA